MKKFAILDKDNKVLRIVMSEEMFPITKMFDTDNVVEISDQTKHPVCIGSEYIDGKFTMEPRPFPSWIPVEDSESGGFYWEAPVMIPDEGVEGESDVLWLWNEDSQSWEAAPE